MAEQTPTRSSEICLAQVEERSAERTDENESEAVEWVRATPFSLLSMRRLTVGGVRTGKTVGAQAAASRVLGACPEARVVVFTPVPNSYNRVSDLLAEKTDSQWELPRAERMRPDDLVARSEGISVLPPVSIAEPGTWGKCEELARAFASFGEHLSNRMGDGSDERISPVYLIIDEADQLLSRSDVDFRKILRRFGMRREPIAVHALAQSAEQFQPVTDLFNTIDLRRLPERELKRFDLSEEDRAFMTKAVGPSPIGAGDGVEADCARKAAPTGLCYTEENGWYRSRFALFNIEWEALVENGPVRSSPQEEAES